MVEIDFAQTQEVTLLMSGDGLLPALYPDTIEYIMPVEGGLSAALMFVCPFAYHAYYGDYGLENCI